MNLGYLKLLLIISFLLLSSSLKSEPIKGNYAEIQILDKITTKVTTMRVKINNFLKFESLKIEFYSCFKNPPEEAPEDFVLLKIYDEINKNKPVLIYQGWMISSSLATTPLEHPIYDLWIKSCKIETDSS